MEQQLNSVTEVTSVVKTTKTAKTVSKAELTAMVDAGKKKNAIAEYYGLNVAQTTKLLKDCNLTIRKFHAPAFVIID